MNIKNNLNRNKKIVIVVAALVLVVTTILTAIAFLTDNKEVRNVFTVGNVNIELEEPSWVPSDAEDIWAGKTILKDPTVLNTGDNDAYVYALVTVPKKSVITVNTAGELENSGNPVIQELFTYTVGTGWTLLMQDAVTDANNNYYLYAYETALNKYIGAIDEHAEPVYSKSTPVFDSITLKHIIEGQIDVDETLGVDVYAYAIQSNYASGTGEDMSTPAEAWAFYCEQNSLNLPDGVVINLQPATP